jgi:hypothetical protein
MFPTKPDAIALPRWHLESSLRGSISIGREPVSKTGGSRFESWLPRFAQPGLAPSRPGNDSPVGVVAYLLFFVAGLGFGYAAVGKWKWLPILFPLVLALGAAIQQGIDGTWVFRVIIALVVTVGGVLLGAMLDARGERGERARYA